MKKHKNCPICKQEVISDASKPMSCALCGMVIDHENMILLVEDSDIIYFCLQGCYDKYNYINGSEGGKNDLIQKEMPILWEKD